MKEVQVVWKRFRNKVQGGHPPQVHNINNHHSCKAKQHGQLQGTSVSNQKTNKHNHYVDSVTSFKHQQHTSRRVVDGHISGTRNTHSMDIRIKPGQKKGDLVRDPPGDRVRIRGPIGDIGTV